MSKIVISGYASFNYRRVVRECRCGHRAVTTEHHDMVFPFPTVSLSEKEIKYYLVPGTPVTEVHQISMDAARAVNKKMNLI